MTTRRIRSSFRVVLLLLTSTAIAGWAQASELPRYKFKVGQELTYALEFPRNEYKRDDGTVNWSQVTRTWTVWVVDQNAEAGWRMLFREELEQKSNYGGKESVNRIVMHGHFRLSPAGVRGQPGQHLERPDQRRRHVAHAARWGERSDHLAFDLECY